MLSRFASVVLLLLALMSISAQEIVHPHVDVETNRPSEETDYRSVLGVESTDPPTFPVRTMAEWEEIQSLVITWTSFPAILKQIAFHSKQECEVIIFAANVNQVINYLNANNAGGAAFDNLDNITILEEDFDSIWGRDFGAHTIYRDDVDEMMLVDWIYNRDRPADDQVPVSLAQHLGVPLYSTIEEPYDLMATGGNFMSDGLGTAFSSNLILDENSGGNTWWGDQFPDHSQAEIEDIVQLFMGIDRYVLMDVLPFDLIHHIDMHMKLLDEETIILGEYPAGVADGPQIEANIAYVLDNYQSVFGTPYDIVRVQMPPEGGAYPNNNGDYRTYSNMVFVNKTILVPIYEEQYDAPALAIIQEQLPGYNVVGIECNDIIPLSGAIHCITKAVGVDDPMLIVHDHLDDTYDDMNSYQVDASIQHESNIANASCSYRVDGGTWMVEPMTQTSTDENTWTAYIPAQEVGAVIEYYIGGEANSGKSQVRPIVAPEGFWTFEVLGEPSGINEFVAATLISDVYPNPASAITVIELDMPVSTELELRLEDMLGRVVEVIHTGEVAMGEQRFFIDAQSIPAGAYHVIVQAGTSRQSTQLMVR